MTGRIEDPIVGSSSMHEFVRGVAQSILDQRDLSTPGNTSQVTQKIQAMKILDLFDGARETVRSSWPRFDEGFREEFSANLSLLMDSGKVTGMDLVRAFEHTVETFAAKHSKQLRIGMFMPGTYGHFLEYFAVPVLPALIEDLAKRNPELAQKYREQARQWSEGS